MKLVIDCLIYEHKKAPGYESFLFNILDYIFFNREKLSCDEIILVVRENQKQNFQKYSNVFIIREFKITGITKQIFIQNILKFKLDLKQNDVIVFTYGYASIWKQCKSILIAHDLQHLHYPQYFDLARRIQRGLLVPISIRVSDVVIAISKFTKNDILMNFKTKESKIRVIYNDCNFNKFYINNNDDTPGNLMAFINGEKRYLLSVASPAPHKNTITLIKSFISIAKDNKDYFLVLVSDQSRIYEKLGHVLNDENINGQIVFTNHISDYILGLLYNKCDAFILPTEFEGFGMPIVEALYFNALTILSDIEICREIAGDNALYFDSKNTVKLTEIMLKVISGEITRTATRDIVLEKYSYINTSEKYLNLLNELFRE
jgi:glycosyltransferase involved in cell wall biosynthesis